MVSSYRREEYISRINRVQDFIERNLERTLSLRELAEVACFSPYHFHRIFRAITGETVGQFIGRVRVEKAAVKLVNNPRFSITEIAFDCGFSGSAAFARAFKEAFGMSASRWRGGGFNDFRKIRKTDRKRGETLSKRGKDLDFSSSYSAVVSTGGGATPVHITIRTRRKPMKKKPTVKGQVTVEMLPEMTVAYIRHVGPYKGDSQLFAGLWGRLMKWAGPRGLLARPDVRMLNVYHDDPEVTEESKLRIDVCLTVPPETKVDGEVGKTAIPAGKYALAHFEIDADQYQQAWDFVFGQWLPESGYQPDDRPCFEWCLNDPNQHPEKKHIVKICLPVKPL